MLLLHWLNQSELLWTLSQRHHISLILSWPQFPPNNIYVYSSCLERPQFSDCIQFSWHFKVVVLKLDMVVILLWPGSSQKPYMCALWPRDTWVLASTTREGLCSGDCGPWLLVYGLSFWIIWSVVYLWLSFRIWCNDIVPWIQKWCSRR